MAKEKAKKRTPCRDGCGRLTKRMENGKCPKRGQCFTKRVQDGYVTYTVNRPLKKSTRASVKTIVRAPVGTAPAEVKRFFTLGPTLPEDGVTWGSFAKKKT